MLEGGHEYDGRPIVPLDETGMREAARRIRAGRDHVGRRSPRSSRRSTPSARRGRRRSCARSVPTPRSRCRTSSAASACWSARTRRCSTPRWSAWRGGRRGLHRGAAGQRPRRAALPHPERRHRDAGRHRRGVPRLQLRLRPHQQHAGRRVPLGPERRDRHRRRRHHHRHRQPAPRLSARGQQRRRGRRRAHALPHARPALDRPRRRLAGRRRRAPRGAAQRRLPAGGGGPGVRRRHAHRHRRRGRRRPDRPRRPRGAWPTCPAVSSRRRWRACTRASRKASTG